MLFFALFLFGVIASLFGPIKYGILPDHLHRSELPAGNALVEGATFIAILLGTIVGGIAAKDGGDPARFALLMIVFSLLCWGASLFIPRTGAGRARSQDRSRTSCARPVGLLQHLREDRRLWWGAMVTSWFWLVGAVALSLMPPLVKNVLGGNEEVVTACLAIFSISIAIGSGLAAWLAAGRIILLPTLIGAVLLGMFAHRSRLVDLGRAAGALNGWRRAIFTSRARHAPRRSISPGLRSRAACSSCRCSRRCRPGPAPTGARAWWPRSTCSMPRSWRGSTVIVAVLQTAGMTTPQLFLLLGVASLVVAVVDRPHHAGERAQRCARRSSTARCSASR